MEIRNISKHFNKREVSKCFNKFSGQNTKNLIVAVCISLLSQHYRADIYLKYEQLLGAVSHRANTLLHTKLTIFLNSQL